MGIHLKKTHSGLLNGQLIRLLLLTTFLGQVSDVFLNETQLTASVLFFNKVAISVCLPLESPSCSVPEY